MINGFDIETAPLSDSEKEAVPSVVTFLMKANGSSRAVLNQQIVRAFPELRLSSARVRKIINHIRQNNLVPCLIASSKGYYVAESERELLDYEDSLRGRELAIRGVRESIEKQRKARYCGLVQGRLF